MCVVCREDVMRVEGRNLVMEKLIVRVVSSFCPETLEAIEGF